MNPVGVRGRISGLGKVGPNPEQRLAGQLVFVGEDAVDGDEVLLEEQEHLVEVANALAGREQVQADVLPDNLKGKLIQARRSRHLNLQWGFELGPFGSVVQCSTT